MCADAAPQVAAPAPAPAEDASMIESPAGAVSIGDAPASPADAALSWLRARGARWGLRAAERLAPDNDFLVDLDLHDSCGVDDEGATHIAVLLRENTTITSVDLSDNVVEADGARQLSEALRSNASITSLVLRANSIGESGAQALADMLLVNTTLTELDVSQQKEELSDTAKERLRVAWGQRPEDALLR